MAAFPGLPSITPGCSDAAVSTARPVLLWLLPTQPTLRSPCLLGGSLSGTFGRFGLHLATPLAPAHFCREAGLTAPPSPCVQFSISSKISTNRDEKCMVRFLFKVTTSICTFSGLKDHSKHRVWPTASKPLFDQNS